MIANLVGEPRAGDIELDVIIGEAVPGKRGRFILPVEVRIPLDQLVYEGQKPISEVRPLSAAGTTPGSTTEISETVKRIEEPPTDLVAPFITWKVDLVMPEGGTKDSVRRSRRDVGTGWIRDGRSGQRSRSSEPRRRLSRA